MAPSTRTLIFAPMASELRPLVRVFEATKARAGDDDVFAAERGEMTVTLCQLGVGPVIAARTATRLISHVRPDRVVVCGIAGGVAPPMAIGTVLHPLEVVDAATGRRFQPSPLGSLDQSGVLATVDHLISDLHTIEELLATGVSALDMETSGVASVCEANDVAWSVVRVISDRPDGGLTDDAVMGLLRPDGSPDARAALHLITRHPGRLPGLMRLGRDSSRAAAKAAKVTAVALS